MRVDGRDHDALEAAFRAAGRGATELRRRGHPAMTMRKRFYGLAAEALDADPRVAMVFAEIGVGEMPKHPRMFNVGIREQLMIGVAAGPRARGLSPCRALVRAVRRRASVRADQARPRAPGRRRGARLDRRVVRLGVLRPHAPGARRRRRPVSASRLDDPRAGSRRRARDAVRARARRATTACTSACPTRRTMRR